MNYRITLPCTLSADVLAPSQERAEHLLRLFLKNHRNVVAWRGFIYTLEADGLVQIDCGEAVEAQRRS